MKPRLNLMIAAIVVVLALGFYVFAQTQNPQRGMGVGRGTGIGPGVPASADVILCRPDGAIIDKSFPGTGTLRVEYKNGSISTIDLTDVKKMTVVPKPGR